MRRRQLAFLIILGISSVGLLASCDSSPSSNYLVRVRITSAGLNYPIVVVNVEGLDGDALTSALVTLTIPGNRAYVLDYQADYGAYRKVLDTRVSGTYTVSVDSALDTQATIISVEHTILSVPPTVVSLIDSDGTSTASGLALSATGSISASWTDLGQGVVYAIIVSSGLNVVYQDSSSTADCVLPAGVLPTAAHLTFCVTGIRQYGDPLLASQNYVSVSSQDGSPYGFDTK